MCKAFDGIENADRNSQKRPLTLQSRERKCQQDTSSPKCTTISRQRIINTPGSNDIVKERMEQKYGSQNQIAIDYY